MHVDNLRKIKNEFQNMKKWEIEEMFLKLRLETIDLTGRIALDIKYYKYYMINHLKLQIQKKKKKKKRKISMWTCFNSLKNF